MQAWVAVTDILRNLGIVIGIVLAWHRVVASNKQADAQLRQAELSRRSHVTELFNRAIGQLKDERLEIRLGAILTLGQVCRDFRDLADPVIKLLSTYLREMNSDEGAVEPSADVAEIMRIIAEASLVSQED